MKKNIVDGIIWNVLGLFVSKGFGFFVQIVLARLLLPEHFGIIGMAVVFTNVIIVLGELGIGSALVQMKESKLSPIHLYTTFWSSIGINILLYLLVVLLIAPFTVWFYEKELFYGVISVLSIQIVIKSFIVIPKVLMVRELDFKRINLIEILCSLAGGIGALILANNGAGVWSIVFMGIINATVSLPFFWYQVKWKPKFLFSKFALKDVFGKGIFDTLQRIFMSLTSNVDYLIIGKLVNSVALGYYTLAFVITDTFRQQIMNVINKVLFPVFGKLQDDKKTIKNYYLKIVRLNSYIITPLMLVLIGFTGPILSFLVGEEWLSASFPIKAMAVASIVHSIGGGTDSVLKGLGNFKLNFKVYTLKTLIVTIPAFYIGVYYYGINGAAVAIIIHKAMSRIIFQILMKRLIQVRNMDLFLTIIPTVIGTVCSIPIIIYYDYYTEPNGKVTLSCIVAMLIIYFAASIKFVLEDVKKILKFNETN